MKKVWIVVYMSRSSGKPSAVHTVLFPDVTAAQNEAKRLAYASAKSNGNSDLEYAVFEAIGLAQVPLPEIEFVTAK